MTTIFVTSSGTDVGKTFVMLRLIAELAAAGRRVQALKPVASGFDAAQSAVERHRAAVACARARARQRQPRRREPMAFRGAVVARHGRRARTALDSVRCASRGMPRGRSACRRDADRRHRRRHGAARRAAHRARLDRRARRTGAARRRQLSRHVEPQPDGGGGAASSAAWGCSASSSANRHEQPAPAEETAADARALRARRPSSCCRAAHRVPLLPLLASLLE